MSNREKKQWQHHAENKEMRKVRKQIKRHRKTKRTRRKDWMPDSYDDMDALHDLDVPTSERVMPRGEATRRQAALEEALARLRAQEEEEQETATTVQVPRGREGIVVEVSSSLCRVALNGRTLICGLRGSLSAEESGFTNVIAVGDRVIVSRDGSDRGIVEAVLPRRSVLARPDAFTSGGRTVDRHLQQVIVANVDQLLVVASWRDPPLWPELVDRYLIAAERNHLSPVVCVNKVDLAEDIAECQEALRPYADLGYRALYTSAVTGQGVDELRDLLHERTTVLAGMSGVGKSSLLTAVQPGLELRVAQVSERSHEGRHTTTQVSWLALAIGGAVVDTPGIREFGLRGLTRAELVRFYPEIAAAAAECRFSDCSHDHEPGCAVQAAVERGVISATRYHSYRGIYDSL